MRGTDLVLISALALTLAFDASAQQRPGASESSDDSRYCNVLAKTYQSMYPVQEGMSASDVTLLSGCETDPHGTIPALQKKLTDKKIDVPPPPGIAEGGGR